MDRVLELLRRGQPDGRVDDPARSSHADVRIDVMPLRTSMNLRGAVADPSLVTDVQRVLGVELPVMPNRWHGDARMAIAWLGPDEWLIIAPDGEAVEIEGAMRDARPTDPWLSLVDVSHSYTTILLSGPDARDLLATGCTLDLRTDAFGARACAQSVLAKSRVLLRCLDEDAFELSVRPSFARYTTAWLLDAADRLDTARSAAGQPVS